MHSNTLQAVRQPRGALAKAFCGLALPVTILRSAAGFYLGTADDGPVSRESLEYFPTFELAEAALKSGEWTQREEP